MFGPGFDLMRGVLAMPDVQTWLMRTAIVFAILMWSLTLVEAAVLSVRKTWKAKA